MTQEAIAQSVNSLTDAIESNDLNSVKIEPDQKGLKITVKLVRPSGQMTPEELARKAILTWNFAADELRKQGYTVAPLGQPAK